MKGKLFLIHWNPIEAQEYAYSLRDEGWDVDVESKDDANAGRKILSHLPDAIVIYLSRLPVHGSAIAMGLRSYRGARDVPIVFVDGKEEAIKMTKAKVPEGMFTSSADLSDILGRFSKSGSTT